MTTATLTAATGCTNTEAQLQATVAADGPTNMLAINLDGARMVLTRIEAAPLTYRTLRPADGQQHIVSLVDVASGATVAATTTFPASCPAGVVSALTEAPTQSLAVSPWASVGGATELAFTGSTTAPFAAVGLLLAVVGAAMIRCARRSPVG